MGMDIYGINSKGAMADTGNDELDWKLNIENGVYFRANVWAWRPLHALSFAANHKYNLNINMEGWDYNEGKGCKAKTKCIKLADALEKYAAELRNENLKGDGCVDNGRFALNLNFWFQEKGGSVDAEIEKQLKEKYKDAFFMRPSCELNGVTYRPAYSTTIDHLSDFITFLRNCGGFEIW